MGIEGVTANLHVVPHNLYTLLYLLPQCMEGASSKKVLTINVTAAITKHKVSVVTTVTYETKWA